MSTSTFNPPFRNNRIDDFFGYECQNQHKAVFLQGWIADNYPDLNCKLMYLVPMYLLGQSKVFYLNYFKSGESLELEMCFSKGATMNDTHNLFQTKNKVYRAIMIISAETIFLDLLRRYIDQAIELIV